MKHLQELVQTMGEHLTRGANVRSVYGDPVVVGKKTVIPVARIGYGYGAGFGGADEGGEGDKGSGGGLGAGLGARPAGVLEVTKKRTRFIPHREGRGASLVLVLGLGVALGFVLGRGRK